MSRSTWRRLAGCAVMSWLAIVPASGGAQTIDDLGKTLDGDGPGKNPPPAKTPARTPATPPARKSDTPPAKTPNTPPALKPGEEPGAKPVGPAGPPARPAGGITVAGNHYASLDEFMFGMWRWRNNKGELLHLSFFRSKSFLAFNTSTQVRVYGRFWTVANRQLHVTITRICRYAECRPPPRQIRQAFPTYPVSTNVVRNGNERWTRIRRF